MMWFHLMPYPKLPDDFNTKHRSVWVDVDSRLFDARKANLLFESGGFSRQYRQLRAAGRRNLHLGDLRLHAAFGTGIAISNTRAAWQAFTGKTSPFVRTPKGGALGAKSATSSYKARTASGIPELCCAAWAGRGLVSSWRRAVKSPAWA